MKLGRLLIHPFRTSPPFLAPDMHRRTSTNVLDVWLDRIKQNSNTKNTIFKSSIVVLARFIKQGSLQIKIPETFTFVVQSVTDKINIFAVTYQY